LEPDKWNDVMSQVLFPFLLAWLSVYVTLDSARNAGFRWGIIVIFALGYICWLGLAIHKDHGDQMAATFATDNALCAKAEAEERIMDQSQNVFNYRGAWYRQLYSPSVISKETKSLPLPHDFLHMSPQEQENSIVAFQNTAAGKAYTELQNDAIQAYLLEAQPLQELDSELNRRLGKTRGYGDAIEANINVAKGLKRNFLVAGAFSYTADYLRSLSSQLCPVKQS
jgi:hypothetical protein